MLCFWFAIFRGALEEAQYLYTLDPIIPQIMKSLKEKGVKDIAFYKMMKREEKLK